MIKKNHLALYISLFEIIRWMMIYFFFLFVKSNFETGISAEKGSIVWFISAIFGHLVFAAAGILIFVSWERYFRYAYLWIAYKLFFIILTVISTATQNMPIQLFLALFIPVDIFLVMLIAFIARTDTTQEES